MNRPRVIYVVLTTALAGVVVLAVLLLPSGREASLPGPLEGVFPGPGDAVIRQTVVEIDLPVGYRIDLFVDGDPIPATEIGSTLSTGRWTWQPGPGLSMERWPTGAHTVRVTWDRVEGGRPDPGEYEWQFRVQ